LDPGNVAEHRRGARIGDRNTRISRQQAGSLARPALDRRRDERIRSGVKSGGGGLDGRLQVRPAREPQLAGDQEAKRT
jgi:hypothetical protein